MKSSKVVEFAFVTGMVALAFSITLILFWLVQLFVTGVTALAQFAIWAWAVFVVVEYFLR